jgi:alpha-2-macroglobulin
VRKAPYLWMVVVTMGASCGGARGPGFSGPWPQPKDALTLQVGEREGLSFRLREGSPPSPAKIAVGAATPLNAKATAAVLSRLPAMSKSEGDEKEFALRRASKPPPRAGRTVKTPFPPPKSAPLPDAAEAGPLRVVRMSPSGEVGLAPSLSITFSQPMVAVTSVGELGRQSVPVKLTPEPPGQWRWLGTKTLVFEPSVRFAMATEYTVEVPAGTKSATGGALAKGETRRFGTSPPKLELTAPVNEPSRRDPLMLAVFDQRIDPAAVLATVKVTAGGSSVEVRPASAEEIKAEASGSSALARALKEAKDGRWLSFRPVKPLPPDAAVTVSIGPGIPSAEGPRSTDKAETWSFRTYGPLKMKRLECGLGSDCRPLTPFTIEFSTPIDARRFDPGMVHVEPALPGMKVSVYGNQITITGRSKGRTKYQVTLAPTLLDEFGQALGPAKTVTFPVQPATRSLRAEGGPMVVLDPATGPRISVYSVNIDALDVEAYAVGPEHWDAYGSGQKDAYGSGQKPRDRARWPPGRKVISTSINVNSKADELTETRIDLAPALPGGLGQLLLIVNPSADASNPGASRHTVETWVQATRIGLDAFVDSSGLVAWATSLVDGKPLEGVGLTLEPGGVTGKTGANGIAQMTLGAAPAGLLVARKGADVALISQNGPGRTAGTWQRQPEGEVLHWFVFDDRGMYRPGEEVKIKGWIRRVGMDKDGDVAPVGGAATEVSYKLLDDQGNELARGSARLSGLGGFDAKLALPKTTNAGTARLELTATGGARAFAGATHEHMIRVQEFRRPEFEVTVTAGEGPHFVKGHADVTVSAAYYAGGPLPYAAVDWTVTATPAAFTPPNRSDFTFGTWTPWWRMSFEEDEGGGARRKPETWKGKTDASGKHHLRVDLESAKPPRPHTLTASGLVTDVNRQAWMSSASLLVHPSTNYVGLKTPRLFVQQGEPLRVDAIVTDLDGKAVPGRPIAVRAVRLDLQQVAGEQVMKELDPEECKATSGEQAVQCSFHPKEGGRFQVTASIADADGRPNETELTFWVAGGKAVPSREIFEDRVTMIPDRQFYKRGDTAEVLMMLPFWPAEALVSLRRSGLVKTERLTITGSSHTLKVPIEDAYVPNIDVHIDIVGASTRTNDAGALDPSLPKRPAYARGSISLLVPPVERALTVRAVPREARLEPGAETAVDIELRDAAGKPVGNAEVAVVVVDEAILALSSYELPNPLALFYATRRSGVSNNHMRESVILGRFSESADGDRDADGLVDKADADGSAPGGGAPRDAARPYNRLSLMQMAKQIKQRTNFNALATFAPAVPTDAAGRARVAVKLPDSLTRYRVMAVAVAGGRQFGAGESTITARLPLMVRPSAPRFLNYGDRFELPIVLQNQTAKPLEVDVAVRAANASLTAEAGRRVTVAANDRIEVRFPAAAERAGTARFQVGATSDKWADAAEVSLPVWTPATTEAFATYGELDQGVIAQPVAAPSGVVKEFGGLEITTSSTALQALTDAVVYLVSYPFECSEQLASRVMAVAALRDVLAAFQAKGLPEPAALLASVKKDIERLELLQNEDGGFGFWRRGAASWPYLSIHVAHALQRAKDKGFAVPASMLEDARDYLRGIAGHIPRWVGPDARRTIVAYALATRARMGERDVGAGLRLVREAGADKLPIETAGFVLTVLSGAPEAAAEVAGIRRSLENRITETAGAAHFVTSYADDDYVLLHSDRRADAIVLEALIGDQPKSDVIPKLVAGLLGHRTAGRWASTQENAFVLLALDRYFQTYEKATPDFVARAWLGSKLASEQRFKGRSTERQHVDIPMKDVAAAGKAEVTIAKEGSGRLYYRIGMRYAPKDLKLGPSSNGFTVERVYEGVDQPSDVQRAADGAWRMKAGARVRVRLSLLSPARRYHVALVDPLPAGLEPLNSALAVTGEIPQDPKASGGGAWWGGTWYEHENLRDERVEAFTTLLWEGVHTYTYVARATTPGSFVVPPPKAEEMYHPETFGRGAADRVIVE